MDRTGFWRTPRDKIVLSSDDTVQSEWIMLRVLQPAASRHPLRTLSRLARKSATPPGQARADSARSTRLPPQAPNIPRRILPTPHKPETDPQPGRPQPPQRARIVSDFFASSIDPNFIINIKISLSNSIMFHAPYCGSDQ